jgi:hypothetical protein
MGTNQRTEGSSMANGCRRQGHGERMLRGQARTVWDAVEARARQGQGLAWWRWSRGGGDGGRTRERREEREKERVSPPIGGREEQE